MRVLQLVGRSTGGIGTHVGELVRDLRALRHRRGGRGAPGHRPAVRLGRRAPWWPDRTSGAPVPFSATAGGCGGSPARADVLHAHGHQAGLARRPLLSLGRHAPGRRRQPAQHRPPGLAGCAG